MSDEPKKKFHQFELALFRAGKTDKEKVAMMIARGTILAGIAQEEKLGGETRAKHILSIGGEFPDGFEIERQDHRAWALGRHIVGRTWHNNPVFVCQLNQDALQCLARVDKSPLVRVAEDVIGDAESGAMEFRDFAVLCAVYAPIGNKEFAIVRRDRVRAGMLGYNCASVLFDDKGKIHAAGKKLLAKREDGKTPLTTNQIRHTLNRLHARKFFSRIQPRENGRTVYYSRSLDHEALADKLLAKMERSASADTAQDAAQLRFREKSKPLLKRLIRGEEKQPKQPFFSPGDNRSVTGQQPEESPQESPETIGRHD